MSIFSVYAGDDVELDLTILKTDGTPYDLTGCQEVNYAIARDRKSAALVTKTLGSRITITDAVNGKVQIVITSTDTEALDGTYYHEVQVVDASGLTSTCYADRLLVYATLL